MKRSLSLRKMLLGSGLSVLLSAGVTSCKENTMEKYVGTWQSVEYPGRKPITFKKVGSGLNASFISRYKKYEKEEVVPVSYNESDGSLMLSTAFTSVIVTYNKETDRINITRDGEYKRVK